MIRNESEILHVGTSKPSKPSKVASRLAGGLRGAVSAPARYGAPRSKKYMSKMKKTMILYMSNTSYTLMISRSTGTRVVYHNGMKMKASLVLVIWVLHECCHFVKLAKHTSGVYPIH